MTTFTEVPSVNRSPKAFTEIDESNAGAGGASLPHALFIGRMDTASGSATADGRNVVTSEGQANALFGPRSQIAAMIRAFLAVNSAARITAIGLDDAGTAASGDIAFSGTATENGAIELRVAGQRVIAAVTSGDTATVVGAAVNAALASSFSLPVVSTAAAGNVDIDAAFPGPEGNDLRIEVLSLPAGITAVLTSLSGGATSPVLTSALAALEPDTRYDAFVLGPNDATSLSAIEGEIASRWLAPTALGGHGFAGHAAADIAAALVFGATRNAEEMTIVESFDSDTPPYEWAAEYAAIDLGYADPAAPRFGARMNVEAPGVRPNHSQRNQLLEVGLSTWRADESGTVTVDRMLTTYQSDASGNPSNVWRALTTRRTVDFLRKNWTNRISAKYLSYKLADDGTNIRPGQKIATPSLLRSEAIVWAREMEGLGLIEDVEGFKERLAAWRPSTDNERIDVLITPDLVNELVTVATLLQFRH